MGRLLLIALGLVVAWQLLPTLWAWLVLAGAMGIGLVVAIVALLVLKWVAGALWGGANDDTDALMASDLFR